MKYADIEDDIVTRLTTILGTNGLAIMPLPETQVSSQKPFDKVRITVAYNASMFGGGRYGDNIPHMSTSSGVQEEAILLKVSIEARVLRGASGIYEFLTKVRQALLGYEPLGLDRLALAESKFEDFKENLWIYTLTFVTHGVIIEEPIVDTDPLLTTLNFDQIFTPPQ